MTESFDGTWYVFANPGTKQWPQWARQCALDANGDLWLPAALGGNEMVVVLACGFDGETVVTESEHAYVRAAWLEKEFPKLGTIARRIVARLEASPVE
jgi:hypothetical protein